MLDWQTIAVILIVLAALAYTARRALSRLRSFRLSKRQGAPACSTGCGSCGDTQTKTTAAPALVRINTSRRTPGRKVS